MAKVAITEQYLEDIADAIREKTGLSSATFLPSQMAPAILTISGGGGIIPTGTLNITSNNTYDVTQYATAVVNVPTGSTINNQDKIVTPNESEQSITLAYRSVIASSAPGVGEWCDSLSKITFQQFAGQPFSGDFVFNNISFIDTYAFGSVYTNTETGSMYIWNGSFPSCTKTNNGAFYRNRHIEEVYFPQCSTIGENGFRECNSLTSISFPICTTIGTSAFQQCKNLKAIDFSVCTHIGVGAFSFCFSLSNINFPNCTTISGQAFYCCSALTVVSFPNCTSIQNSVFYSCKNLLEANFSVCTHIGSGAFQNCFSLSNINFPNCAYINQGAFSSCYCLSNINFPNCTQIDYAAFSNCSALTVVSFPNCISIGNYAFQSCSALTVVSFPNCISIGQYAFRYCINLSSFYFMGSSIPSILNATFANTTLSLSSYLGYYGSIYVPASLLASYQTATNWSQYSSRMVGI